jgi:hypothetical protein
VDGVGQGQEGGSMTAWLPSLHPWAWILGALTALFLAACISDYRLYKSQRCQRAAMRRRLS